MNQKVITFGEIMLRLAPPGNLRLGQTDMLEAGSVASPSKVIYDRANAAISQIERGMINWEKIFEGAT